MSQSSSSTVEQKKQSPHKHDAIITDAIKIIIPASQAGAISGATGLFVGAITGILRSTTPVLFSLASGIQFSVLGTTVTAFRELIIHSWDKPETSAKDKLLASTIAGALGGGTSGAILRGRSNIIPGAIMFAIFGITGQLIYNKIDTRSLSENVKSSAISNWSPVRSISDAEYASTLRGNLLQVRADIAKIDNEIEALKAQQRQNGSLNDTNNPSI